MSEFKYACPVCGQHMKCDSSQSGLVMECPTCFQKIIAPQAPASDDPKFIITGTKVGERPAPKIAVENAGAVPAAKGFPLGIIILLIVIGAAATVFAFRGKFFHNDAVMKQADEDATASPQKMVPAVQINLPLPTGTNFWTLNVDALATPGSAAAGRVHGKSFVAEHMVLDGGTLTLRTQDNPPEAGVSIYLHANLSEELAGQTINIKPGFANAPQVNLRFKDATGQAVTQTEKMGYAMRIEFGQITDGHIAGKIYLCAPDEMKSYVVGIFNAEILKPKPPR
jgi:DNA-directed RNA polymerase subunit RPC12/RpoP